MKLWALVLCSAAIALCAVTAFAYVGNTMPTATNDHLLDGVPGIGGPKR